MKGIGGHAKPNKGETNDWLTPLWVIRSLGEFDLDPCCPPTMPWKTAKRMIHWPTDGMHAGEWVGRVWLNPPYGAECWKWLDKLADHGDGVAIVFARTETKGFFETVWGRADGILFIRDRLHFAYPDGTRAKGNAGGPSALVAYGESNARALASSGIAGAVVTDWSKRNRQQQAA